MTKPIPFYPARKPADLDPMAGVRDLNYSEFVVLALRVIGANMQCKLFVALQLEVAHHFIE